MSAPRPHSAVDLALAPVLIEMERNLERFRGCTDLEFMFALELNDDARWYHTAGQRARRVLRAATRGVDLHGWTVGTTPDLYGLTVGHGDYRVSLMLGKRLADYIAQPAGPGNGTSPHPLASRMP